MKKELSTSFLTSAHEMTQFMIPLKNEAGAKLSINTQYLSTTPHMPMRKRRVNSLVGIHLPLSAFPPLFQTTTELATLWDLSHSTRYFYF